MSDHESDDERLAAFLDGRMDASRREEMLARLNASDEDRALVADTAGLLRDLEEEDAAALAATPAPAAEPPRDDAAAEGGVLPLDARRRSRAPLLRRLALAAAVAGAVLVTGRLLQGPPSVAGEPVRLAARLEHADRGLPAGWTETRPWTSARGDDPGAAPSAGELSARSARAGAMLVDLSVAVRARDSAATRVLAGQLAARFDPQGGRSGPLREIADGAGASPERLRPLVGEATERIAGRLDPDALRLGAWTEAAGLAAASRDAGFFRDAETRRMLDRAGELTMRDPAARDAVQQVRLLLADDPPRWEALAPALDALARELASE